MNKYVCIYANIFKWQTNQKRGLGTPRQSSFAGPKSSKHGFAAASKCCRGRRGEEERGTLTFINS